MFHFRSFLCLALLPLILLGCSSIVKQVDYAKAPEISEDAHPAPIQFRNLKMQIPPGTRLGQQRGGTFCTGQAHPISRAEMDKQFEHKYIRQAFHDAMEASGYDVVAGLDLIDEELEGDFERAEYSISGIVRDIKVDACTSGRRSGFFFSSGNFGTHGEMYISVDWTIWDPVRRKTAYKTTTEGYVDRKVPNIDGLTIMFQDAFEMAAHNLAADTNLFELIVNGKEPPHKSWRSKKETIRQERWETRPRKFDPLAQLHLTNPTLSKMPFNRWTEEGRQSVVTIQKFGHGSGIIISKKGHILTNAHVVGDAMRTHVITANKKHKIPAEILRIDKARDVALLRLEEIPDNFNITTLPIKTAWPSIGTDIYAMGAPQNARKLHDTVTKGIVSAHRKNYKLLGTTQNFIQGDVEIHGGNSGGPLVDEYGNLVGLAVASRVAPFSGAGIGLNYFIPIEEALERLNITLNDGAGTPQKLTTK